MGYFNVPFWPFLFTAQARSLQMIQFSPFWLACKSCTSRSRIVWKLGFTPHYSFFCVCVPKAPKQPTNQAAAKYKKQASKQQQQQQKKSESQSLCKPPWRDYLSWADWQGLTRGCSWKHRQLQKYPASRLSAWVVVTLLTPQANPCHCWLLCPSWQVDVWTRRSNPAAPQGSSGPRVCTMWDHSSVVETRVGV